MNQLDYFCNHYHLNFLHAVVMVMNPMVSAYVIQYHQVLLSLYQNLIRTLNYQISNHLNDETIVHELIHQYKKHIYKKNLNHQELLTGEIFNLL